MNLETLRTIILSVGWPILIIGSIFFILQALNFHKKLQKLPLGKLILATTMSTIVSMFSLGIVATFYMMCNVKSGLTIVIPGFFIWLSLMTLISYVSSKWTEEAIKINVLYYKIKQRTRQLEQEKDKLSHVAKNMSTGAILLDAAGKVMFINKEANNIIGFDSKDEEQILGAFYQKFSKYNLQQTVSNCINGKPANIFNAKTDGRIYEIFLRCLSDNNNPEKGYFGHFIWIRDVTAEKQLENSRNKFITVASHKLNTPLSEIRSSVDLLNDAKLGKLNIKQKKLLSNIKDSSQTLLGIVSNLLNAIETDTKKIQPKKSKFKLKNLVKECIKSEQELCSHIKCNFTFKCTDKNTDIKSDRKLVKKCIKYIIENALIYSAPNNSQDILVQLISKKDKFVLKIQDYGIGIPQDAQPKIFEKFFRAENALKAYPDGTGLSLNILQETIKELGGEIWFKSLLNKGTAFYISLPKK